MIYEIWQASYYNKDDYWMIEEKYFATKQAAQFYCDRKTEKDENYYYFCTIKEY